MKAASGGTKSLSMLGKMKNLKLVKMASKGLGKTNAFVRLVTSGMKSSSKWVNGIRALSSTAKIAGRACWVAAIGINCYEVYDSFKKGGIKKAAPKALQCATETACAWGGAKIGAAVGSAFGPVGTLVGGVVGGLVGYFVGSKAGKYVVAGAKKLWNGAKKLGKAIGNGAKKVWNTGKKVVSKAVNTVKNVAKKAVNTVKNTAKKVWNAIKFW